jgi:hypothetical protein
MNQKLFLIPIILGIAAVISVSLTFVSEESSESQSPSIYDGGFTYYDIETIQTTLAEQNITVSTPVAVTDHTVSQYCTFFENQLRKTVDYCTTTNVLDSEGKTLGNINMGGDTNSPILAIANLETTNLESNRDDVLSVIEVMIETLVCDCWEEEKSDDDLESISAWVDAVYNFYNDSGQRNVKSQVDDLGTSVITLEVTSKENSILRTLIILK